MAEKSKFFEAPVNKRTVLLKQTSEQETKIYDAMMNQKFAKEKELADRRLKTEQFIRKRIAELQTKATKEALSQEEQQEIQSKRNALKALAYLDKEYKVITTRVKQQAADAAATYEINQYKKLSAAKRREYHDSIYKELKEGETARKQEMAAEEANIKALEAKRAKIKDKRGAGKAENEQAKKEIAEAQKRLSDLQDQQTKQDQAEKDSRSFSKSELLTSKEARKEKTERDFEANADKIQSAKGKVAALDEEWKQSKKNQDLEKEIAAAKKSGNKEELKNLLENQAAERKAWEEKSGYLEAEKELTQANFKAIKDTAKNALSEGLGNFVSETTDKLSANLDAIYGQQGRMMGRLQGSDTKWNESVFDVTTTVGVSGIVSQKNVIAKMVELVDSGVAYNLEMRAFLAETSENIASTFNAANGTLLRLIRLQQSDTTAARLGMEATLTKLFNKFFEDTSYLTDSGPADTVASAIMDASATMDKNKSLEFEFTVQKWLGSLYSLGMSSDAVQKIAEGINYLGTGNVSALSGNTALQTLFAMSASKAGGKSYAEMLTTGLTSEDTNKLLRAMIEYLADIADSQTNYVTKSAYADLFNMSITDLSTFSSLTSQEISNLYNQTTSYNDLMNETKSQLLQTISRVSVAELVDTAIENAEVGAASLIGSNPVTYGMWKALALLKDYVGEVKVPGIIGMGTGIASGLDLLNLAQTAMAGMGLIGSLVGGLGSMMTGGVLNFNKWNYEEYTSRGGGLSILDTGSLQTTSYSASVGVGGGGGAGEAASDVSLESGKEQGMEAAGITSEEMDEQQELPQKIYDALAGESTPNVLSLLEGVNARLDILNSLQGVTYDPETNITNIVENESTPNVLSLLEGVSDNSILGVLQEIDGRLDPSRVFYTAIVGSLSSDAAAQVMTLSSQIATAKATSSSDAESTKPIDSSNRTKASTGELTGAGKSSEEVTSLEDTIAAAVEQAIRNIAGYSSGTGLPVTVTNLTNGGVL